MLLVDGGYAAEDLQERLLQLMGTIEGFDPEVAKVNLHLMSRTWQDTSVRFPDLNDRDGRPAQGDKPAQRAGQDVVLAEALRVGAELVILDNYSTLAGGGRRERRSGDDTELMLGVSVAGEAGPDRVHPGASLGKTGATYRGSSKSGRRRSR